MSDRKAKTVFLAAVLAVALLFASVLCVPGRAASHDRVVLRAPNDGAPIAHTTHRSFAPGSP